MHVVIIASSRQPIAEPFAGGLESLTWHLVCGLRRNGIRVTLFAGAGSDRALHAEELPVSPLRLSAQARQDTSMVAERWLGTHHAYLQVMLKLQHRDDVNVVHNNSLHHLPIALAELLPVQLLTTLHTPPTPWLEPAIAISTQTTSAQLRFAAVSTHTAEAWAHVTGSVVVPNGIDVSRWTPGAGGQDLIWFGRIVPEKAPHIAIGFARESGRALRIAGPIGDRDYFDRTIAPHLDDNITYVGHLRSAELVQLVGASAVSLVTPVWDEPYGLVAAESLACGTPVVALDRGGLGEFISPDVGILLPSSDPEAGAQAIEQAAVLSRAACRRQAIEHCSIEQMVDRYIELYAEMSQGHVAA